MKIILRTALLAFVLFVSYTAQAADYVLTYVSGGTTYYLALNGTSGVQRVSVFDPTTCIWSCASNTAGTTASTLGTSNRYLFQMVDGTRYFLSYNNGFDLVTNAGTNARIRSNANGVYFYRGSGNAAQYMILSGVTPSTSTSSTGAATAYQVTTAPVGASSMTVYELTSFTLSPMAVTYYSGDAAKTFTASATATSATATVPAHTTYVFNETTYYYYNNRIYARTEDFATPGTPSAQSVSYSWSKSAEINSYLTLSATTGASITGSYSPDVTAKEQGTLTVTVNYGGGNTDTRTASIVLYAPIVAPTIERTGTNVTLATTSEDAVIYYTLDGTVPSDASAIYSGPVDISALSFPLTVKAVAVRGSEVSGVVAQTIEHPQANAPVITIEPSGSTATVTISADAGFTIRYTTDGTTPTESNGTSAVTSVTIGDVANMTTIKAYATKTDFDPSEVVTGIFITTGVSGNTVILDDREDHTWTYYSEKPDALYPDRLHSPNPRNVKITYSGGSVAGASAVAVSATEDVNTFVYYKTIEKYAWGGTTNTIANTGRLLTGEYAYRTIHNPFSKRPATGTGGSKVYYGFAGWKVISGGEYISEYNNNATIPADQLIHFVDLPAGNEGNGAIELEAQWTQATVTAVNDNVSGNPNNAFTGGTFETNFVVVSGSGRTISGLAYNVTVMGCYPDGTGATGATLGNVTGSTNNLKIENVNLGNGTAYQMNTGLFYIGRGCTGNVSTLYNNGASATINMCVESGTFRYIHPMANGANNTNTAQGRVVFGCDYDRATNDGFVQNDAESNHTKRHLRVVNYVSSSATAYHHGDANTDEFMDITVKSGFFGFSAVLSDVDGGYGLGIGGNTDAAATTYVADYYNHSTGNIESHTYNLSGSAAGAGYWQQLMSFYTGTTRAGGKGGVNRVLIEGGEFNSINGGGYRPTNPGSGDTLTNYHFRMKGGWVKGAIYGTASASYTHATTKQVITGGEINGWIAGACNGTDVSSDNNSGWNRGNTYIYFGGTAELRSHRNDGNYNNTWGLVGGVPGGNIFASGRGCEPGGTNYNYCGSSDNTYTVVADKSKIEQSVYGGGFIGVAKRSHIFITGGEIGKNVYGGASTPLTTNTEWRTSNTDIRMYGGLVKGGIYGGHYMGTGDIAGKINGDVKIAINGGQVGVNDEQRANIHGGGFGEGTTVAGNVTLNIGTCDAESGATVFGDVYGGSAMGTVNDASSDNTTVNLYKGTIYGGLYGGGYGPGGEAANVNGAVQVNVFGGSVLCSSNDPDGVAGTGSVFGCNNISGAPQSTVKVDIYNTDQPASGYALHAVYGGGNKSPYNNTPVVTIHGCSNSIEYVYGGGNATDVRGTNVTIWGGTIGNAFAGGNGAGAGNPGANITLNGTKLYIHGGEIGAAFGGSNERGTINGGIRVDVDYQPETATPPTCVAAYTQCPMLIGELYGGGNKAPIVTSTDAWIIPVVNIACEAKIGMLFGGAKAADYGGNINLVVDGGTFEKVFGGNNQGGTISGSVKVTFNGGSAKEVYGGCNESGTNNGSITVNIDSTNTTCTPRFYVENVYGGGNLAKYTGNPAVNIINGTVRQNVYGGGFGSSAIVTGTPVVTVGVSDGDKTARVLGHVFGGGNAAAITGSTNVNILYDSYVKGHVFGGGNAALVSANTFVLLRDKAKVYGNIYGGGNMGEVGGNTKVVVNGQ